MDPATSTLNFPVSDNRANGVFAPLDGLGALSIVYKASGRRPTHVILDVTGYFVPGTGRPALRAAQPGPDHGHPPGGRPVGQDRVVPRRHRPGARWCAGHWGVPASAQAFTGNLTVTAQTGVGYVAVSPAQPAGVPTTSTLNFPLGDNRANGLVSPLDGPAWARRGCVHRRHGQDDPAHPRPVGLLRVGAARADEPRPVRRHVVAGRRASAGSGVNLVHHRSDPEPERPGLPRQRGTNADRQVRRRAEHRPGGGARRRRHPGGRRARRSRSRRPPGSTRS